MTRHRHYKTWRNAQKRLLTLRAMHPDKLFILVPDGWGWAVALHRDGRKLALCA